MDARWNLPSHLTWVPRNSLHTHTRMAPFVASGNIADDAHTNALRVPSHSRARSSIITTKKVHFCSYGDFDCHLRSNPFTLSAICSVFFFFSKEQHVSSFYCFCHNPASFTVTRASAHTVTYTERGQKLTIHELFGQKLTEKYLKRTKIPRTIYKDDKNAIKEASFETFKRCLD